MTNLPFGFERPEDSPGFLLWQTTMIWQRQIKKELEAYNVSHAGFVIMATLMWFEANGHDTTQTFIVNQTKLDKMTVSKSLRQLVTQGFVNRIEHKVDTRAKIVTLTEQGKKMLCTLIPLVEAIDTNFFGVTSSTDTKNLINLLQKLIRKAED